MYDGHGGGVLRHWNKSCSSSGTFLLCAYFAGGLASAAAFSSEYVPCALAMGFSEG